MQCARIVMVIYITRAAAVCVITAGIHSVEGDFAMEFRGMTGSFLFIHPIVLYHPHMRLCL